MNDICLKFLFESYDIAWFVDLFSNQRIEELVIFFERTNAEMLRISTSVNNDICQFHSQPESLILAQNERWRRA